MASPKDLIKKLDQETLDDLATKSKSIKELLDQIWPLAKTLPRVTHDLWQCSGTADSIETVISTMFGRYDCPTVELEEGGLKNGNKAIHAMFKFLDVECQKEVLDRETEKLKQASKLIVSEWLTAGCPDPTPEQKAAIMAAM